jgi:plastocyanin
VIRLALRVALLTTIGVVTACAAAAPASAPAATPTATTATTAPPPPSTQTPTSAPTSTPQPATPSPAASAPATAQVLSGSTTVEIGDNFYLPQLVIIATGTRVMWVNRGQMTHTASARDESFNSGNMEFGQTYERVFAVVGRYTYYCVQHEDMIGIVEVR